MVLPAGFVPLRLTRAGDAPVCVAPRATASFFFFLPPVALAFLCILGLLSCIWGIVVWVLGVLFWGFLGFGGFSCLGVLLYEGITLFLGFYCIIGGSIVS